MHQFNKEYPLLCFPVNCMRLTSNKEDDGSNGRCQSSRQYQVRSQPLTLVQNKNMSTLSLLLIFFCCQLITVSSYSFIAQVHNKVPTSSRWSIAGTTNSSSRTNTSLQMYVQPNSSSNSQSTPMVAQSIFPSLKSSSIMGTTKSHHPSNSRHHHRHRRSTSMRRNASATLPLSNSVLSSRDTLPSFPTAHGLLSPETVLRMEMKLRNYVAESSRASQQHSCDAVEYFLKMYRNHGPMACLPMLTDLEVLPKLTEFMKDVY